MSSTVLTINLDNLAHNYAYLRSKINPKVKLLAVVKAVAYGSDAIAIATHLETLGVDYFGVAYTEEGVALRESGITTPILVLHPQPTNFNLLVSYKLEPSIYSQRLLKLFASFCLEQQIDNYPIHIKYNSGLNRLGFADADIPFILDEVEGANLLIKSLFSHLAASEDVNERAYTMQQIKSFKQFSGALQSQMINDPITHQSNTSGILNYPEAHFSMVRTGIGLYGFGNEAIYDENLKPVASLTSVISQIHEIPTGGSLGYNRGFIADTLIKSATVALGHADGISRMYGHGKGFVYINGQKAPILGNVCMDMLMVNVTHIDCKEGDEVIIFNETYSAASLAEAVGTISYELITGIAPRVKRILTQKQVIPRQKNDKKLT